MVAVPDHALVVAIGGAPAYVARDLLELSGTFPTAGIDEYERHLGFEPGTICPETLGDTRIYEGSFGD